MWTVEWSRIKTLPAATPAESFSEDNPAVKATQIPKGPAESFHIRNAQISCLQMLKTPSCLSPAVLPYPKGGFVSGLPSSSPRAGTASAR